MDGKILDFNQRKSTYSAKPKHLMK